MPLLLPSFRRQQRVLDFAALQQHPTEGIYITLSPDNPAVWTGVLFVRDGPYESAVLRYEIRFPDDFPEYPPLVTFSTDVFHPLVVPLTQYTFNAGALDGTTAASESDRLPPGALSLRHGFPRWYKQGRHEGSDQQTQANQERSGDEETSLNATSVGSEQEFDSQQATLQILKHIKAAFEDATLLDSVPYAVVGNPSAWHAWRAFRGLASAQERGRSPERGSRSDTSPSSPKQMSEWNWDGVWESRVLNAVESSISEAGLYTNQGLVRFAKVDNAQLKEIRQQLQTR